MTPAVRPPRKGEAQASREKNREAHVSPREGAGEARGLPVYPYCFSCASVVDGSLAADFSERSASALKCDPANRDRPVGSAPVAFTAAAKDHLTISSARVTRQ